MTVLATTLQEFLWADRDEPLYAAHPTTSRDLPKPKEEALAVLRRGANFFSPVPRTARGNERKHCAVTFNALYCDIDLQAGISLADAIEEVYGRLEPVRPFWPSAIVFTGNRGMHAYWKLIEDLSADLIEAYNKRLIELLGADRSCYPVTQLLRHPGTINEKSGRKAELIEFSAAVYPLYALDQLGPPQEPKRPPQSGQTVNPGSHDTEWLEASWQLAGWGEIDLNLKPLMEIHHRYMRDLPAKGWRRWCYASRSEIEEHIVYLLVGSGASDAQINEIADEGFARHREEYPKRGDRYIQYTIDSARCQHHKEGQITSPEGGSPHKRDAQYRHTTEDEMVELAKWAVGQPMGEWISVIREYYSRATAYRLKDRLVATGAIEIDDDGHVHARKLERACDA